MSNHWRPEGLLNRLFRRGSKKTTKFRATGLCERNPPVNGRFPSQRACNAENVFTWWRHHEICCRNRIDDMSTMVHRTCNLPYLNPTVLVIWHRYLLSGISDPAKYRVISRDPFDLFKLPDDLPNVFQNHRWLKNNLDLNYVKLSRQRCICCTPRHLGPFLLIGIKFNPRENK